MGGPISILEQVHSWPIAITLAAATIGRCLTAIYAIRAARDVARLAITRARLSDLDAVIRGLPNTVHRVSSAGSRISRRREKSAP